MDGLDFYERLLEVLEEQRAGGMQTVELSPENRTFLASLPPGNPPAKPRPKIETRSPRYTPPKPAPPVGLQETSPPPKKPPATVEPLPDLNVAPDALADLIQACRRCPLGAERTQAIIGEGDLHAQLMFIGEGPTRDDEQEGHPFSGPQGQLLTRIIKAMKQTRETVYLTHLLKCRLPPTRRPTPKEAHTCLPFLQRQIELIAPRVMVLLGSLPLEILLRRQGLSKLRGTWLAYHDIPVMPTYHPAFLLRLRGPRLQEAKKAVWDDMQQVMQRLGIPR